MKSWYLSRTIWANVIAGVITVASIFGFDLSVSTEDQAKIVAGVLVVVNIILRFDTSKGITK